MRPLLMIVVLAALASPAAAQPDGCAQKARKTAAFVADLNADASAYTDALTPGGEGLARLPASMPPDVQVDAKGTFLVFGAAVTASALRATMKRVAAENDQKLAMLQQVGGTGPLMPTARPLVVAVHPQAPWSSVVALLRARPTTFDDRVRWLFGVPPRAEVPAATWVRRSVADKRLPERSEAIAKASGQVARRCPSYRALLETMRKTAVADSARVLADGIEEALVDCQCQVDLPALHDLLYVTLHSGTPAGFVDTRIPHGGDGVTLAAKGKASFGTVAPRLLERAKGGAALTPAVR